MKQTNLLKTFLLLCALVVGSTCAWADTYTYNFSSGGTHNSSADPVTNTWVTTYFTILQEKGSSSTPVANYLTSPRWYKSHTITITPASGYTITQIDINCGGSNNGQDIAASVGSVSKSGNNSTWTGSITSAAPLILTMGSQCRPSTLNVTYTAPAAAVATPTFSPAEGTYTSTQNVTLSCTTDGADIYYTLDGSAPTSSSTPYTSAITVSETKTIKAIAIKGSDESNVATATYTILPVTHAGTEADPFTVTDARNALTADATVAETDYYVKGFVAKKNEIKDGTMTYWISDDGTMTSNIQCYHGKYIDGADFTDAIEFEVGDVVTVKGKLLIYQSSTYEFAENNEVVSISTRTKVNIASFTATTTDLVLGGTETTETTVTNDQPGWTPVAYSYESDDTDVATVDASGVITAVAKGTAKITVTPVVSASDPTYKVGDSKSIEITVKNPIHTVTFSVNGNTTEESVEEGEDIVFPANPAAIGGKSFVGWVATPIVGTTDEAPSFVSSATMSTSDLTYYAVFAGGSETQGWLKMAASDITEAGTYALLTTDGHAFNGTISSGHGQATTDAFVFVNNTAENAPEGTCEITLTVSGDGFTMYNADNKYLYASKAASGGLAWHASEDNIWKYSNENWEYQKSYSGNMARLRSYNNSSFRTYSNNNGSILVFAKKTTIPSYSAYCTTVTTTATVTAAGWATYVTPYNMEFAEGDAFVVSAATASTATLAPVTKIGANKAVLLKGEGVKTATVLNEAPAAVANELAISTGGEIDGFVLAKKNDKVGFYKWNGGSLTSGKVYLPAPAGARDYLEFSFDETTALTLVNSEKRTVNSDIYNLAGQRVAQPTKGLYIVNGRKVVVK